MAALNPDALLERALGDRPFHWQSRLLRELLDQNMPRALDLPTGLGKTAVMAIWLVARACGATWLPRRLVYVVDRRAVVDQATREAESLKAWLRGAPDVCERLGLVERELPISTLRGQFVDNRRWLEDPSKPAIVVGTVDMIGSRLLFEGYACSRKMRPFHAGLLGADTLFVLDEAHLVPPFERLLEAITEQADLRPADTERARVPGLHLLSLSATGRDHGERTFALQPSDVDESDPATEIVRARYFAMKRLRAETLPDKARLADVLAERAWTLASEQSEPARVIVFCNRRDDAQRAQDRLRKLARAAKQGKQVEVELFVGARRHRERSQAEERLRALGFLAGSERPGGHTFLFATSAGEVGVDLDADHMVADVVAWERMVQRLGRVNRRGGRVAQVLLVADPESPWAAPVGELLGALPTLEDDHKDASPAALLGLRRTHGAQLAAATTPEPLRPALSRPLLEAWAMTSLTEHTGRPEVQPWLRGWEKDDFPQTVLVWRRHFPPGVTEASARLAATFFDAAPPHATERLETETYRVVEWLVKRASDVAQRRPRTIADSEPVAWALDTAGEPKGVYTLAELVGVKTATARKRLGRALGGACLVVLAELGGLSPAGLLDEREDAVPDTVDGPKWFGFADDGSPIVPLRFREASGEQDQPTDDGWRERLRVPLQAGDSDENERWLVIEKWRNDAATEDDRSAGRPQELHEHHDWTARVAEGLAEALGLPDEYQRVLVLAARLHDEGKRAKRWQRAFHTPDVSKVYAKTRGPVNVRLLDGYRHELGSYRYAREHPEVRALPPDLADLVLHLIVAHHGFARPAIRTAGFDDLPPSAVTGLAREVALRFVRLQRRWGPWGLAWWEALLRAADQRASRANDEGKEP